MPSAVREILKVAERPDVLSFAGGLPAPELFPARELARPTPRCCGRRPAPRCSTASPRASSRCASGWPPGSAPGASRRRAESVIVASGSQQGIDLVARVLLDPGRHGAGREPQLPGRAPGVRRLRGQRRAAARRRRRAPHRAARGRRARAPARAHLRGAGVPEPEGHDARPRPPARARRGGPASRGPVLEDDPYGALRFRGVPSTPIAALDRRAHLPPRHLLQDARARAAPRLGPRARSR